MVKMIYGKPDKKKTMNMMKTIKKMDSRDKYICNLILLFIWLSSAFAFAKTDKMAFWTKAPHGANMFSENPESDFKDISRFEIRLIRFGALGAGESHRATFAFWSKDSHQMKNGIYRH